MSQITATPTAGAVAVPVVPLLKLGTWVVFFGLLECDRVLDVRLAEGEGDDERQEPGDEAGREAADQEGTGGEDRLVLRSGAHELSGRGSRAGGVRRAPTRERRCRQRARRRPGRC